MAGSSATLVSHDAPEPMVGRIVVDLVGDDATGAIPTLVLPTFEGRILALVTDPGSTGPTNLYDITLVDSSSSLDVLGGAGANRSTSNTERAAVTAGYVSRAETLTLTVAGTSVNSATARVIIYYTRDI